MVKTCGTCKYVDDCEDTKKGRTSCDGWVDKDRECQVCGSANVLFGIEREINGHRIQMGTCLECESNNDLIDGMPGEVIIVPVTYTGPLH